mmetsp:Transcript_16828/g.34806  ORF Transcript_16828/g.34806 Transcript_16828/m.34806 type:complete len:94 (-) Transcript_16828:145-426(-)
MEVGFVTVGVPLRHDGQMVTVMSTGVGRSVGGSGGAEGNVSLRAMVWSEKGMGYGAAEEIEGFLGRWRREANTNGVVVAGKRPTRRVIIQPGF